MVDTVYYWNKSKKSKTMKILYISHNTDFAGSNKALLNMAKNMILRGHVVKIVIRDDRGPLYDMLKKDNIPFSECGIRPTTYCENKNPLIWLKRNVVMYIRNLKCRKELLDICIAYKPDIIHSNIGPMDAGIYAATKLGIPHVWHHREYTNAYPGTCFFPSFDRFLSLTKKSNNFNICITKGIFQNIKAQDKKDVVIYDGIFSERESHIISYVKDDYILFVGRIEAGKGPLEIIKVFAKIVDKYPNLQLKLAGKYQENDIYYNECLNLTRDLNIENRVDFLGFRKDVDKLMSKAKLLVVNSVFEGFGFITAEAMLNYCPVVGRDTTGTKEQFDTGLYYSGNEIAYRFLDQNSMYNAIMTCLNSNNSKMCELARKTVISHYSF